MTQLALVIDLNVCVGCHACVTSCKEWNTSGAAGPDGRPALRRRPDRHLLQPRADLRGRRVPQHRDRALPQELPALRGPALRAGVPDRRLSYKRKEDGIVLVDYDKCIGCKYCSWACPYGARELDEQQQVMTKCTLCVDRIYDMTLPEAERKPACVLACPTSARLFGDVHDPTVRGVGGHPRPRRLPADARMGHAGYAAGGTGGVLFPPWAPGARLARGHDVAHILVVA
jgi:Fe-S-cluster-containing dehydrogenase component